MAFQPFVRHLIDVTYLLFLRLSLVVGKINLDSYGSSLEYLRQHIADRVEKRPHLQVYLDAIHSRQKSLNRVGDSSV